MIQRKIIAVRKDAEGIITHGLLNGNIKPTPVKILVKMADKKKIEKVNSAHPINSVSYVRANHDKRKNNNLANLPKV